MKLQERIEKFKEHANKLINNELITATDFKKWRDEQKELALAEIDFII